MSAKIFATFLAVVIALPFTAPWSVCDIADVQAAFTGSLVCGPRTSPSSVANQETTYSTQADSATVILPTLETREGELRLAIVSRVDASPAAASLRSPLVPIGYLAALRHYSDPYSGPPTTFPGLR